MIFSRSNRHELLAGFSYLYGITDGGVTWKKLSSDLGAAVGGTAGATINAITTSNATAGVMWVGMRDGRVKVTKDLEQRLADLREFPVMLPFGSVYAHLRPDSATLRQVAGGESTRLLWRRT